MCIVPSHNLSADGNLSDFWKMLPGAESVVSVDDDMPAGDDKNLERNADWEAQVKTFPVNFVTCELISR